ncbi:sigma factor-like helix-turn-helix DNA-binding protein [Thermicanus aegyptius]|uniref:sigma factor-like helix-turn-helix DNA-binding protein n=1 Tax=Thermicanus aegyptius TaxID=94009 RepID=UPI0004273CF7|nr:sigma factor-like helix-turn-helix DNA-binding protein [Thermicanus aegyptius]
MRETWVDRLIQEYSDEKKVLEAYRAKLDRADPEQEIEYETIGGMISDLQFALQWMRRGRRPGNLRGVDITDVYRQRALLAELMPKPDSDEAHRMVMLLLEMSVRERTCFLLHMAYGLTYSAIADRLKISRATVQKFVERAKSKVEQAFIA